MTTEQATKITLEHNQEHDSRTLLGFWIYLMTDLLMFSALFAAYIVLRGNTFGGPSERDIFNLPSALIETMLLLTSSFTSGLAMLAAYSNKKQQVLDLLIATGLLGGAFLAMELLEFSHLFQDGHTFQKSASLSAFFTLVGTHGLHITVGLFWMILLIIYIVKKGITKNAMKKLTLFSLFWHFLDIVWIFIFTVVYLMGTVV